MGAMAERAKVAVAVVAEALWITMVDLLHRVHMMEETITDFGVCYRKTFLAIQPESQQYMLLRPQPRVRVELAVAVAVVVRGIALVESVEPWVVEVEVRQ